MTASKPDPAWEDHAITRRGDVAYKLRIYRNDRGVCFFSERDDRELRTVGLELTASEAEHLGRLLLSAGKGAA